MSANVLVQAGIGSTDANGGKARAGGTHTGTATITMLDGATFLVASNRAEVQRKRDLHAVAQTAPVWVAFDVPASVIPLVLNVGNIASVR